MVALAAPVAEAALLPRRCGVRWLGNVLLLCCMTVHSLDRMEVDLRQDSRRPGEEQRPVAAGAALPCGHTFHTTVHTPPTSAAFF